MNRIFRTPLLRTTVPVQVDLVTCRKAILYFDNYGFEDREDEAQVIAKVRVFEQVEINGNSEYVPVPILDPRVGIYKRETFLQMFPFSLQEIDTMKAQIIKAEILRNGWFGLTEDQIELNSN